MSLTINKDNVATGALTQNKHIIHNINFWHQLIISNTEKISRDDILSTIIDHVYPLDLIPTNFHKENDKAYFLARSCGSAIEKLCMDGLELKYPKIPNRKFTIEIIIKFSTTDQIKIDVSKNISTVLEKRFTKGVLDLNSFHKDPDLSEFCPLSQPKIMYFVLHMALTLKPRSVLLAGNQIKSLVPLETLADLHITALDIRENQLEDVSALMVLKKFAILKQLQLDKNPVCNKFENQYNYVLKMREICPSITLLDGQPVTNSSVHFAIQTNFMCNYQSFDAVNRFLHHYFTIYDSPDRSSLMGLYDKNARFSLTYNFQPSHVSSRAAARTFFQYKVHSRNLATMADLSKKYEFLYQGSQSIQNIFCNLSPTEHDPFSMQIDLMHDSPACMVVVVNGFFKELHPIEPQGIVNCFSRTFILRKHDEFLTVLNDQLHITNAKNSQLKVAFNIQKPESKKLKPVAITKIEKEQVAQALSHLTNMSNQWSKKCLNEANYDLKEALLIFVDLYKQNKIPEEAFIRCQLDTDGEVVPESKPVSNFIPIRVTTHKHGFNLKYHC